MAGLSLAFTDFRTDVGIFGGNWVGLQNFRFFFTSDIAFRVTRNTVAYGVVFIALSVITGVAVALLLGQVKRKSYLKVFQTSMILPSFLSWVIVGYITYTLLSPRFGILNQMIEFFGGTPRDWFLNAGYWPYIITSTNLWRSIGLGSVIYYAALMGVDPTLYEAATVDGANKLKQAWYISIPSLVPLMITLTILNLGNVVRGDFGLFYIIPRDVGLLYPTTDIIDTFMFRGIRGGVDIGMAAAVGFFQSFVGLIMVLGTNLVVRRISKENALF
jgi:putative aldouronate transport system permease protein